MKKYIGVVAWVDADGALETWQVPFVQNTYPDDDDVLREFHDSYSKSHNGIVPEYEQVSINLIPVELILDWVTKECQH